MLLSHKWLCLSLISYLLIEFQKTCLVTQSACLYTTHAIARQFLSTILWMMVSRITNKYHVYVGCKIAGNGEKSW